VIDLNGYLGIMDKFSDIPEPSGVLALSLPLRRVPDALAILFPDPYWGSGRRLD
jgi:hypothetical protein